MANTKIKVVVEMPKSSLHIKSQYEKPGEAKEQLKSLETLIKALNSGAESGLVCVEVGDAGAGGEAASGEITISGSGAQSVTINGATLTGGTEYEIANLSNSKIAEKLAKAIADSQSSRVRAVIAEASSNKVILKAASGGQVGNLITLAATGDASASGANLSGGVDGVQHIYKVGVSS